MIPLIPRLLFQMNFKTSLAPFSLEKTVVQPSEAFHPHRPLWLDYPSQSPKQAFLRLFRSQRMCFKTDQDMSNAARERIYQEFRENQDSSNIKQWLSDADEASEFLLCGVIQASRDDESKPWSLHAEKRHHYTESPFVEKMSEIHVEHHVKTGGCGPKK